jgi:plastocyanin
MRAGVGAGSIVILVATLVAGIGSAFAASSTNARQAVVKPVNVNVSAGEFFFTLSKKSIPKPGTVTFTVTNKGTIAHNFEIQSLHLKTKMLQPHQKQVLTVKFKKKGSYYYLCTVPRHASEGMAGSFIVK